MGKQAEDCEFYQYEMSTKDEPQDEKEPEMIEVSNVVDPGEETISFYKLD